MPLESGIFLDELKTARVISVREAGDPASIHNYRPISVLPSSPKILK